MIGLTKTACGGKNLKSFSYGGSGYSNPANNPITYLLSFTAPASGTETVSWNAGYSPFGYPLIHWGDGTADRNASHSYTGLTPGERIDLFTTTLFDSTWTVNNDLRDLDGLIFYWDPLVRTNGNFVARDMGITQGIAPNMGTGGNFGNFNLRGNSIPGEFPSTINAGTLFIDNNKFTGDLPFYRTTAANYVIKENGFRGAIHDISGNSSIKRYSVYGQDDGVAATPENPRIMLTGEIPNLSACNNLLYYHVGNGGETNYYKGLANNLTVASDFDVHPNIENFFAGTCGLSQSEVDLVLAKFAAKIGTFNNPIKISVGGGNAEPSNAGLANKAALIADGWSVISAPDF